MAEVNRNPYDKLVGMLQQRLIRQESALSDTKLQLEGARESRARWDAEQRVLPLERAKK